MGCCSARCTLVSICIFQMVFVIERTILDALGPLYGLVIADGMQFLLVIVGIVGTYTYKPKYLVPYGTFQFLWIGLNAYLLCFYLEVGWLSRKGNWEYPLTLSLNGRDFFDSRLVTCNGTLLAEVSIGHNQLVGYRTEIQAQERPEHVWELLYTRDPDCLVRPLWFKIAQCAIQVTFSFFTILYVCYIVYGYADDDDCFDFIGGFDHFNPGYPESKTGQFQPQQQPQVMYQMQHQQPLPGMQPHSLQQQHSGPSDIQPHHSMQSQQSSARGAPYLPPASPNMTHEMMIRSYYGPQRGGPQGIYGGGDYRGLGVNPGMYADSTA